MLNDFIYIFSWWVLLFSLGVIFLPLNFFFFQKFFDKGYAFSKVLGILILSYLTWLSGSLKILPFTEITIWFIVALLLIINFLSLKKLKTNFKKIIKERWRIFLFEEILFLVCLSFWSFIRGFQPDIQGLEKFMDYGFVNSILRSRFFPPTDMWLAGETINYYYFGHLITAVLTKISGIDSAITYNLMIATLFALCFTAAFSLGGNFISFTKKNWKSFLMVGVFTGLLLTLSGNLHTFYYLIKHGNFNLYWYPDATRFIVELFGAADNTIHEFPLYSFVVADLHGHLLNLPLVLLFLSLVFSLYQQKQLKISYLVFLSFLLGIFYITNAWDLPIYFLVLGLTFLIINYQRWGLKLKTFYQSLTLSLAVLLMAFLFSLPFHLHFKPIADGISLVDFHSPSWMLLVLWGFPLFTTFSFLLFLKKQKSLQPDYFVLILLTVAWFLVFIPEILYLKDIYIHSHQRANTMFKLTYQSFIMFTLVTPYIFTRLLIFLKKKFLKAVFLFIFLSFALFIFIYPYFAIKSYYGLKEYQSLKGISYLENFYSDDYQAILWLKKNITNQPVIVEAVGESYTDFARVSANTGLPTILGWRVHEWLWRGSFDEPDKRTEEVKIIYESLDINESKQLLRKYRAEYLFLGKLEYQTYPELKEEKISQLGKIIFNSGKTKIFQLSL
jgi:uncharacterized membrane protein